MAGAFLGHLLLFPELAFKGHLSPLSFVMGFMAMLGHGLWITMDRKRHGREIGWWRFGAILLGPLIIWLYLALEYRLRALYLIPLHIGIWLAAIGIPMVIAILVMAFQGSLD